VSAGAGADRAAAALARPALIADIGGTNARFALTDLGSARPDMHAVETLPCCEYASLQHAAEAYLARVGVQPTAASIAVACPVDGDAIRLTNRAWAFSRRELQGVLGFERFEVINDFGAVAWAVPALAESEVICLHGEPGLPQRGPVSVLGPGTGLGVALLVGDATSGWHVVETEGGHVSFAPIGEEEQKIQRWMNQRFGRTSNERLLCGVGLSHIDAALRDPGTGPSPLGDSATVLREPAAIVEAALEGHDLNARRTLARFCSVLGSVAGDTALIHGAKSVMIAGGIVPRFVPFLQSSAFRERFLAKGRFAAYLEKVSIHVITHPQPGLLGAASALRQINNAPATGRREERTT
jgi:glucokinase